MGVLHIPRPLQLLPSSPTRSITSDMISSPLSPDFDFDTDTLTPSTLPALEYISTKLQQKSIHVTLMVGREKPYPTGDSSDLVIIPAYQLEPQAWKSFCRIVGKGARKFSLGKSWTDALSRQPERTGNQYLIQQSILQNDVLFSQEGLTLLNVDRLYTLKRRLSVVSSGNTHLPADVYINSCVKLLRKTIQDFQGRPFSKAFFYRVYDHMNVTDDVLLELAFAYKATYGQDGIVAQKAQHITQKTQHVKKPSGRAPRVQKVLMSPRHGVFLKRGPRTPLSASDVTPITKNEWNILISPEFLQQRPAITMWTPSPMIPAYA
ncbi:hypothetical protein Egran_00417 [Elaphomyces granulatus]|uniref:DUF7582 domain-containing protein n=1 Tax=Elaphomyces granulatus TaxID=519963 RepID=A0A232M5X7_9EURO|nr:hypothetical protein Egran_00417 [Elaphomyces granulatus]